MLPKGLNFTWPNPPTNNYIDELVNAKLRKLRMTPSEVCSDEAYMRRAFLDVIGKLPTVEEYNAFMADSSPDKRAKLIDDLLSRKEFTELWVMKWAELLAMRSSNEVSYKSMLLYYNWLQDKIANNVPMDDMVRELLGSKGGTFTDPATNYYQVERDTLKTAENVAQVFMGMRIQCAQCHNHPFDRWTMDDYYSFSAFFSQIGRKRGEDPRELIIFNSGGGEVKHPVDNRVMTPKFLGGATPDLAGRDRREVVAEWLVSADNPYFATNLANIVWAHFLGQGIIEQVDDVRVSNPASNPELLDALGKKFIEYDYDFKRIVKDICTSLAYQRSTQANESNAADTRNFAKTDLRRIRAEILLDCIISGHGHAGRLPRIAEGCPGCSDRRREHEQLLPRDVRPRNPHDRLFLRSEDGAEPVAGAAFTQRRHGELQGTEWRARSATAERGQAAPRRLHRPDDSLFQSQADRRGARRPRRRARRRGGEARSGAGRHVVGAAQQPRVFVQPLIQVSNAIVTPRGCDPSASR